MGHSYISCKIHYVFSTKERMKMISPDLQERLWPYMAGIAKKRNITVIAIGGTEDHVHMLVALPSTITIAKAIKEIKGISSKWIHESYPDLDHFAWQSGYGAFSVSVSQVNKTIAYIKNQKKHHRVKTFKEELVAFLDAHGIEYDDRYIWK